MTRTAALAAALLLVCCGAAVAQSADPFQGVRPAAPTEPRARPAEPRPQAAPPTPSGLATIAPFCQLGSARGATSPGGAQTTIRMTNTGAPCRYTFYRRVEERLPTASIAVAVAPQSGRAEVIQPNVVQYVPRTGFTGSDRFTIDATPAPFRVTITVEVLPPGARP